MENNLKTINEWAIKEKLIKKCKIYKCSFYNGKGGETFLSSTSKTELLQEINGDESYLFIDTGYKPTLKLINIVGQNLTHENYESHLNKIFDEKKLEVNVREDDFISKASSYLKRMHGRIQKETVSIIENKRLRKL